MELTRFITVITQRSIVAKINKNCYITGATNLKLLKGVVLRYLKLRS